MIAGLMASVAALESAAPRPNLLFFMADDLGWHNVGWHNAEMKTPHADALIAEGLELERHYAFPYCSPSRSSLMSGRLPFHVQQKNKRNCDTGQGVPRNMTFLSAKLKAAGYQTVHVGKWHLGMSSWGHIPYGRGFDKSLVFFEGAEDHWTQRSCEDPECIKPINDTTSPFDFWHGSSPATAAAGSRHSGYQFNDFAVGAIEAHDANEGPLFMYLAPASSHTPLEPPPRFLDLYPSSWYLDRRQYAGLCSLWDETLGNVTAAVKAKPGMWEQTLLVFSSDNGGPVYWSVDPLFPHGAGANNWPLLGGKTSNWEGGVRVVSVVSGGFLPSGVRGTKTAGYVHMADWYATFCGLAGVDPTDHAAAEFGLPPIDSLDVWPLISGANATSPRAEIAVSVDFELGYENSSSLIQGEWKLLQGMQLQTYWQGPAFPNASGYGRMTDPALRRWCGGRLRAGCLYNIVHDPTEQRDVAHEHPEIAQRMKARLAELRRGRFEMAGVLDKDACMAQVAANGNFYGPWLP